ncbi:MAG: pitrilysin family protein [Candidatus Paceibacterota bacterium]
MNKYRESFLENGLRIITCENNSSTIVDIDVVVKAGFRYENDNQAGYAHILEHMLLKGTQKRPSAFDLSLDIDRKGGYYNAFTGGERVHYLVRIEKRYAEEAMEFLSDILFNSLIDPKTLENEKKVITEELHRSEADHSGFLWRLTLKNLFGEHPLNKSILGTEETTNKATPEKIREYHNDFYVPDRSAIIVNGDIEHDRIVALVKRYFGNWQPQLSSAQQIDTEKVGILNRNYYFHKRDVKQTFLRFNYLIPESTSVKNSTVLAILENYLDFGFTSLLKDELRTKRGLVYNISAFHRQFTDAGVFTISTSTTKPKEVVSVLKGTMNNLLDRFTQDLLEDIKKQSAGVFLRKLAEPSNLTDFLNNNYILYNKLITPEEYLAQVEKMKYKDIVEVVNKYFKDVNFLLTVLGPEDIQK